MAEQVMTELVVTELAIYPIKSLGGIAVSEMVLDARGPALDRRFVVADAGGHFLTQREYPRMCLVRVEPRDDVLVLSAPDFPTLLVDPQRDPCAERRAVTVWRDTVAACDMGDEASHWFSAYLGCACRLYFMPEDSIRPVDPNFGRADDQVSFADGFPLLLIGEASLVDFNKSLPKPIGSERFRPNIVVSGSAPYAEDKWKRVRIGAIELDVVKPCSRCAIPSIDPRTGERQPIVSKTLARLRRRGDAVYFGQNLIHRGLGTIKLGDSVVVLE